jgi:hypothetical protein
MTDTIYSALMIVSKLFDDCSDELGAMPDDAVRCTQGEAFLELVMRLYILRDALRTLYSSCF